MTDTRQTWTFAEDEGGTTMITYDGEHHTVEQWQGPDCDGCSTHICTTWLPLDGEHDADVLYRDPAAPRNGREFLIYTADPGVAAWEATRLELGHALLCGKYPLTAPERS